MCHSIWDKMVFRIMKVREGEWRSNDVWAIEMPCTWLWGWFGGWLLSWSLRRCRRLGPSSSGGGGCQIDVHRSCQAGRGWLLSNKHSLYRWQVGKWLWIPLIVRYVRERGMTSQRPASVSCSYEEVCIINEAAERHEWWMNPPQELSEFVERPASLDGPRLHDISGHDKRDAEHGARRWRVLCKPADLSPVVQWNIGSAG